jgi:hypothetical protein
MLPSLRRGAIRAWMLNDDEAEMPTHGTGAACRNDRQIRADRITHMGDAAAGFAELMSHCTLGLRTGAGLTASLLLV